MLFRPLTLLVASLLVTTIVVGCPTAGAGEGEGEGAASSEGEGAAGEGEGEGAAGEGEGEGEGGPFNGSCGTPFVAAVGDNTGVLQARASLTQGSCSDEAGPEDVWSYAASAANVRVVAKVHTSGPDDLDLYARSTCPDASPLAELACSSHPGDDELTYQVATAGTVSFIYVDAFQPLAAAANYTLTIFEQTVIATGDPCDPASSTATCGDGDVCDDTNHCVDAAASLCTAITTLAAGQFDVDAVAPTSEVACAPPGGKERAFTYTTGNVASVVEIDAIAGSAALELRTDCATPSPGTCRAVDQFTPAVQGNVAPHTTFTFLINAAAGTTLDLTETPIVPLDVDDPCVPGSATSPCPVGTTCIGAFNEETCTTVQTLAANAPCDPANAARVCPGTDLCTFAADGIERCVDTKAATCAAVAPAVLGNNAGDTSVGFPAFTATCDALAAPEAAYSYTVAGTRVKLTAAVHGAFSGGDDQFTVFIDRGACGTNGAQVACERGDFANPTTTASASGLANGDAVTIFVEDEQGGRFNMALSETEIVQLNPNDPCTPDSDTAVCPLAAPQCLGGPSPRLFHCLTGPTLGNDTESCVVQSTDALCATGLACNSGTCGAPVTTTSGSFPSRIEPSDPTSTARVDGACNALPGTSHFDRFRFTNPGGTAATVNAQTGTATCGPSPDTAMAVYSTFSPTNVAATCSSPNDDRDVGNQRYCSATSFPLAAGATADVVVWLFDDSAAPQNYTFSFTSNVGVLVEAQ